MRWDGQTKFDAVCNASGQVKGTSSTRAPPHIPRVSSSRTPRPPLPSLTPSSSPSLGTLPSRATPPSSHHASRSTERTQRPTTSLHHRDAVRRQRAPTPLPSGQQEGSRSHSLPQLVEEPALSRLLAHSRATPVNANSNVEADSNFSANSNFIKQPPPNDDTQLWRPPRPPPRPPVRPSVTHAHTHTHLTVHRQPNRKVSLTLFINKFAELTSTSLEPTQHLIAETGVYGENATNTEYSKTQSGRTRLRGHLFDGFFLVFLSL
jgi:hypothetical protein